MSLRILSPQYGGAFTTEPAHTPIRFALPGEVIDPSDPIAILEPSPDRVIPACRHFGVCGGCDYQHAAYPAQLRIKQQILQQILADAGIQSLPSIQLHASEPWRYRNRIRLRVETVDGAVRFGYNRRASRDFLPIVECPIAAPLLLRAAEALTAVSTASDLAARWLQSIAEIELLTSSAQDAVQIVVFTRDGRTDRFAEFCKALAIHLPELTGAGCLAQASGYGAKERTNSGAAGLAHRVLGRPYWVTRGGFFQVNQFLVPKMVELVTAGRAGKLAWDLYAGVGLFSRVLAETFDEVVGVESATPAANDLAHAPKRDRHIRAVKAETIEFLRAAVLQRDRPGLIVMDPPRAGLGPEVCTLLASIAAPKMVYVSCDPTTLARDLKILLDSGYQAAEIHLLDMFPQTFHIEAVVFLTR